MRVEVLTDRPEARFVVGARLHPEGSTEVLTVTEARPAAPGWVLQFAEVSSRDDAEAYRLVYLEMAADPAETLDEGAFYWHEMVDVPVRDPAGAPLGVVRGVYRAGGADVLEVGGGPRGDFDLPIARPFLLVLEPRRGEIVADPDALDLPASVPPPRPERPPRPRRATRRRPAVPAAPRPAPQDPAAPAATGASEGDDPTAGFAAPTEP
jgi:16S rRNA processing protein RimM